MYDVSSTILLISITGQNCSIHLRCFEHAIDDMKRFLSSVDISTQKVDEIIKLFFGAESNGAREKGLVDYENEEEFDAAFESTKSYLPPKLITWLHGTKGRKCSFLEMMKKHMLKPIRIAAGLGNPPNKWDNTTLSVYTTS